MQLPPQKTSSNKNAKSSGDTEGEEKKKKKKAQIVRTERFHYSNNLLQWSEMSQE